MPNRSWVPLFKVACIILLLQAVNAAAASLVTAQWLAENMQRADIVLIDASPTTA